jgi:hypothetical protein
MRTPATITFLLVCSATIPSKLLTSQSRAEQIATSFTKFKHAAKAKHGVRVEKYKDIRSEPTARQNLIEYSGVYEVADLGYTLSVQVANDGTARAHGAEGGPDSRSFELENAKIDGAVLTGTKVYRDGRTEPFEGAFLTRTERDSPTDPGIVRYGLGVVLATPVEHGGITYEQLFYQLRR